MKYEVDNQQFIEVIRFGSLTFTEHYGFRLLTEQEWGEAARGDTGYNCPWDNRTALVGMYNGQVVSGNGLMLGETVLFLTLLDQAILINESTNINVKNGFPAIIQSYMAGDYITFPIKKPSAYLLLRRNFIFN